MSKYPADSYTELYQHSQIKSLLKIPYHLKSISSDRVWSVSPTTKHSMKLGIFTPDSSILLLQEFYTILPNHRHKTSKQNEKWKYRNIFFLKVREMVVNNEREEVRDWSNNFLSPIPSTLRSTDMHGLKSGWPKGWKMMGHQTQEQ